jgi:hypothetical protein
VSNFESDAPSHLVARFPRASPDLRQSALKKPRIAAPNGDASHLGDLRERISADERRFLAGSSLLANFGGSH